jgi:hypothetical protein
VEQERRIEQEINAIFLKQRLKRIAVVLLLLAVIVPLFYGGIFIYARIQISQAKQMGVFPTLDEAVYTLSSVDFRGAKVVRVDLNHAEPCHPDGKQPFIWCVSSTTFYDQNPTGYDHSVFRGVSSYYHLKEGWVFMSELIPGFTGQVMELFGMDEVGE